MASVEDMAQYITQYSDDDAVPTIREAVTRDMMEAIREVAPELEVDFAATKWTDEQTEKLSNVLTLNEAAKQRRKQEAAAKEAARAAALAAEEAEREERYRQEWLAIIEAGVVPFNWREGHEDACCGEMDCPHCYTCDDPTCHICYSWNNKRYGKKD